MMRQPNTSVASWSAFTARLENQGSGWEQQPPPSRRRQAHLHNVEMTLILAPSSSQLTCGWSAGTRVDVEKGLRPDPSALVARYCPDGLLIPAEYTGSRLLVSCHPSLKRSAGSSYLTRLGSVYSARLAAILMGPTSESTSGHARNDPPEVLAQASGAASACARHTCCCTMATSDGDASACAGHALATI